MGRHPAPVRALRAGGSCDCICYRPTWCGHLQGVKWASVVAQVRIRGWPCEKRRGEWGLCVDL